MDSRIVIGIHNFMCWDPNFYFKFELTFQMGPGAHGARTVNAAQLVVKELWSDSGLNFRQKKFCFDNMFVSLSQQFY